MKQIYLDDALVQQVDYSPEYVKALEYSLRKRLAMEYEGHLKQGKEIRVIISEPPSIRIYRDPTRACHEVVQNKLYTITLHPRDLYL